MFAKAYPYGWDDDPIIKPECIDSGGGTGCITPDPDGGLLSD